MKLYSFNRYVYFVVLLAIITAVCAIPAQSVAAASLDVSIGNTQTTAWTVGPVKPGDSGHEAVVLRNTSAYAGSVSIWLSNIVGTEGTPASFGFTPTPGGDLKDNLELDLAGAGLTANFALPSPVTNFPQSDADTKVLEISSLAAGAAVTLNWHWNLPYTAGNEVQGDGLTFDINYGLAQNIPAYYPSGVISSPTPIPTTTEPAPLPPTSTVSPTPPGGSTAGLEKYVELQIPQAQAQTLISDSGMLIDNLSAVMPDGSFSLSIPAGTKLSLSNENRLNPVDLTQFRNTIPGEILVTMPDAGGIPAYPEGWIPVSPSYDINAVTNGYTTGLIMDQPATLVIRYDEKLLPAEVDGLAMFYYSIPEGWVQLEAPPGFVAEGPQIAAGVSHFTLFAILAKVGAPNPPANIVVQKLTLDPPRIEVNQSADVKIKVTNKGGVAGDNIVTVTLDGKLVKSQPVYLKPGETTEVDIVVKPGVQGMYVIAAGSLKAELIVNSVTVPGINFTHYWWLLIIALGVLVVASAFYLRRRQIKSEANSSISILSKGEGGSGYNR